MNGDATGTGKDVFNQAVTVFSGIGHSMSRFRKSEWRGRHIRHRSKYYAEYSRVRTIWLVCLFCLGVFFIAARFELCRIALYVTPGDVRRYSGGTAVQTGFSALAGTRMSPLPLMRGRD
jgi:hypothetical protein